MYAIQYSNSTARPGNLQIAEGNLLILYFLSWKPGVLISLSASLPCVTNGDRAIIISGRQFDIFSNIFAHQTLRNVRCIHHTVDICRHMKACRAPYTLYNMCISFYTATSRCGRNLIEVCATILDWAFLFWHVLNTVLLLETWAIIRENTILNLPWQSD